MRDGCPLCELGRTQDLRTTRVACVDEFSHGELPTTLGGQRMNRHGDIVAKYRGKIFRVGQRVRLSPAAERAGFRAGWTGTITGQTRKTEGALRVRRDGMTVTEVWHASFWQ